MTLITRVGCHLCEDARAAVAEACAPRDLSWTELDVDADPELRAQYGDLVPVLLVNGRERAHFRVDRTVLEGALPA